MITSFVESLDKYKPIARTIYSEIGDRNAILFLNGPMGIGKTTFSSMLLDFYNCSNVSSSSYGILNQYQGKINVIHCDFYRFKPDDEFIESEVFPLLRDRYLLVLEWAVPKIIANDAIHFMLNFTLADNDRRRLDFQMVSSL